MRRILEALTSKTFLTFIVGMGATALVVLLMVAIFTSATKSTEIRDQQQQNSPLIQNTAKTLRLIRDCTTPGRPCYERAQRQTARAVGDVNRVIVLASACASGVERRTAKQIEACVLARLTNDRDDD